MTSVRDPREAADVHVADSLVALELPPVRAARRIGDLGSGSGFPGLALAVAVPEAHVTLVESVQRKCAFLDRTAALAGLANVTVACGRAEDWRDGVGTLDLTTARALAALPIVLEYAAPLLVVGGHAVTWRGRRDPVEEVHGRAAAAELGLELVQTRRVRPWAEAGERHLDLWSKVRETPSRFPRRAGMARKRPLRASGAG